MLLEQSDTYGKLPWDGGLMDQPHILMSHMDMCANIKSEVLMVKRSQEESRNANSNTGIDGDRT